MKPFISLLSLCFFLLTAEVGAKPIPMSSQPPHSTEELVEQAATQRDMTGEEIKAIAQNMAEQIKSLPHPPRLRDLPLKSLRSLKGEDLHIALMGYVQEQ